MFKKLLIMIKNNLYRENFKNYVGLENFNFWIMYVNVIYWEEDVMIKDEG